MRRIGGIWGRSAYGPLYEHILKVLECVHALKPTVEAFLAGRREEVESGSRRVGALEHEADKIKGEIRNHLSASIFGSVERSETLIALKLADNVADNAQEVARLLARRATPVPETVKPHVVDLLGKVVEAAERLAEALHTLHDAEEGELPRDTDVHDTLDRVRAAEYEADDHEDRFLRAVFNAEGEIDPVSVVLLMEIARTLGDIADSAENTADCLNRMISAK